MNRSELIDQIAEKTDFSKKDCDAILGVVIQTIMESVSKGEKVSLIGFGTFEPRHRKERGGRNPKTGETLTIPATTVPGFSAGKTFKEMTAENKTAQAA